MFVIIFYEIVQNQIKKKRKSYKQPRMSIQTSVTQGWSALLFPKKKTLNLHRAGRKDSVSCKYLKHQSAN